MPNDRFIVRLDDLRPQALGTVRPGAALARSSAQLVVPRNLPATMLLELAGVAERLADPADTFGRPDPSVLMAAVSHAITGADAPFVPDWRSAGMVETHTRLIKVAVEALRQAHAIGLLLDGQALAAAGVDLPADCEPSHGGAQ